MIVTFIAVIAGAAALGLLLKYKSAIVARFKGEVTVVASKGTASGYAWSGNLPCGCRGESHSCRTR